jgi:proteasome accessory factor C
MPKLKFALPGDERYNTLLSVVALLQREGEMHIDELSSHFSIPRKTMRSMLGTINLTSFMPRNAEEQLPYFIDLERVDDEDGIVCLELDEGPQGVPLITAAQSIALSSGLQYLRTLPGFENSKDIDELVDLLQTAQPDAEEIAVNVSKVDADLAVIRHAILTNKRITCHYVNTRGEETNREIDPLLLVAGEEHWYLRGYCLRRKEIRSFRLDHMVDAAVLKVDRSQEALDAAVEIDETSPIYSPRETDIEVTLELAPEAYKLAAMFTTLEEPAKSGDENIKVKIRLGYLPDLGPLVCRFGVHAKVIAPAEAREVVHQFALQSLSAYVPEDVE